MKDVTRQGRFPRLLVPQILAVGVMLWQAWFVYQPISGDMAFWSPAAATFLALAILLIAGGSFALVRWGMVRPLLLADLAALPFVFFGSLGFLIVFGGVAIVILLLVGVAMTWRGRDRVRQSGLSSPRSVGRLPLAVLTLAVLHFWWFGVSIAYDFIGLITGYGLAEVLVGGAIGAAILLWLDRRPGLLLGSAASLVYIGVFGLTHGLDIARLDVIVGSAIPLASGLVGLALAARDVLPSRGMDLLIQMVVGVACAVAVLLEPVLVPFVVAAALAVERPIATEAPPAAALPATP
ncbi:MAG: hypothetical protein ACJ77X_09720 [Chloroflexota bacterium]